MALILKDRVQETSTANTTVSFSLAGASTGYQTFSSAIGDTNTTYYGATDGTNWEVGLGTYATSGNLLTRTTIFSSSNSGSAVTFSGSVVVFCDYPSSKSVYLDSAGITNLSGNLNFSGSANRISGDMANGTWSNRLSFQSTVTAGATVVQALPNGSGGTIAYIRTFNSGDADNSSYCTVGTTSTENKIESASKGTGTNLPLNLYAGGVLQLAVNTNGVLLSNYAETVFAVTGTTPALSPTNGTIQTWTLSGSSTPTAGTWLTGASMTLQIVASTNSVTWSSIPVTWVGSSAPTLSTTLTTIIELWKVGSTVYGALVGSA